MPDDQEHLYVHLNLHKQEIREGKFENLISPPLNPDEGQFYYDSLLKQFRGWDGTSWKNLAIQIPITTY
ncbi:hypothetical protein, partial [Escherichia coli]|uniref:hypothetical protein n=1 Tax=Escherichia coli TaxID=562 RepID=UPI003D08D46E